MPQFGTYQPGSEPIAGYRLVDFLGRGLFGEVWIADDVAAGRVVAVKIIDLTFSGGAVEDFRVLGLMTALAHANLVPVYTTRLKDKAGRELDLEQAELARQRGELRELVIVMGLGEKSLAERLREMNRDDASGKARRGLPVEELIRYMEGAARGIDYLNQEDHGLGPGIADWPIVHGGVNPRNILIAVGEAQLTDVGISALFAADARRTLATGAPIYVAPELSANQPGIGSDQYGLAISYYELRTGLLPFDEGLGHTSIILAHAHGRLDLSAPVLTIEERSVLQKATELQPTDRYPSCVKFVRELSRAVEELYPDRSVRTLRDSQGVPYPSPLRPDSYWRAMLLPPADGVNPGEPVKAAAGKPAPGDPALSTPTSPSFEFSTQAKPQSQPPPESPAMPTPAAGLKLAYPSVRATPILLPLDEPPTSVLAAAARRGPTIPPRPTQVDDPPTPPPPPVISSPTAIPPPPPAAPRRDADSSAETPEPPAWFREAEAESRTMTLPPGFAAAARRGITVRYYARMLARRTFPIHVSLSGPFRDGVEVEMILPGCDCAPPRQRVPAGDESVTFWAVPNVRGQIRGARVVVRHGGKWLADVPLDIVVGSRAWAFGCAAAGLIAPFAVLGLQAARLDPDSRWRNGLPVFEWVGRWVADHVPPESVGFGLLGLAAILLLWHSPRQREVNSDI